MKPKKTYNSEYTDFLSDLGSDRAGGSFLAADGADLGRQDTIDKIYNSIESTNWEQESKYHNSYYGRSNDLKSKNFDKAMSNCMKKRSNEPNGVIENPNASPSNWKLSDIGKKYYDKEIKRSKKLTSKEDLGR